MSKASYTKLDMTNINHPEKMKVLAKRVEPTIDPGAQPLPSEVAGVQPLAIRWTGMLTAKETGDYNLGLKAERVLPHAARREERYVVLRRRSQRGQAGARAPGSRQTGSVDRRILVSNGRCARARN